MQIDRFRFVAFFSALNQITIKQEPFWPQSSISTQQTNDINDLITRQGISINLQPYLKFEADIKPTIIHQGDQEQILQPQISVQPQLQSPIQNDVDQSTQQQTDQNAVAEPIEVKVELDANGKVKKKRKYKKKPPKPKPPKPGQVHIATALDGTILFCCPECQLAYAEKTELEQHLTVHKIERRYICDICGAGLKRKEHLERHKLGHSPERPHICSVCTKGFKRKEHLNLHFVIHSGDKTEVRHAFRK